MDCCPGNRDATSISTIERETLIGCWADLTRVVVLSEDYAAFRALNKGGKKSDRDGGKETGTDHVCPC